ncbi:MAG: gliding motility-associated C-terminal domain-containing protein [Saprospiraceae bacterium]|nr:gliding motility-associated C-terminal domain-containing protein [Saprospiraceae bacterium]
MKLYCKIVLLLIVGLVSLHFNVRGQCMTLPQPLFLQAPDSICAEKKELVIKASKVALNGAKYLWRMPLKDTLTADSILRIVSPSVIYSGNYSVAIVVDTCRTAFFGPINVQVIGVQRTNADTVKTVITCGSSEILLNSTYKLSGKITGQWVGTEGVTFDKLNAPTTVAKGLKEGESLAIWMLSTSVCPFFLRDTFLIRREITPVLQTDGVTLNIGEASKTIHLGQVAGSNLDLIKDVTITVTKQPKNGTIEILSDGKRLKYNRGTKFTGRDAFELKVCNLRCQNLCSGAVPYTIDVFFDERYPNVTIPKILAPNEATNANAFRIEKVEDYPKNELLIMNRWGSVLMKFVNYNNNIAWNGIGENGILPAGAYYYIFQAEDKDGKPLKPLTGIFYIIN